MPWLNVKGSIWICDSISGTRWKFCTKWQLFCYIHSNCVLSTTIWRKNALAQWKRVGLNFLNFSLEPGGNSEQNGNVKIFFYINSNVYLLRPFEEKNPVALWRRPGRIEFSISLLEPGGNSVLNGNVQLFCYIYSNCVFSTTIWRTKCFSPVETGWIEFFEFSLEPGGNSEQNGNVKIFFYINSIVYLLRPFEEKNPLALWRRPCRIEFSISFLEPGGNSVQCNVQLFCYIN